MARSRTSNGSDNSSASLGFEAKLWLTADKLRNNMDAAEPSGTRQTAASSPKGERGGANQYKHVVLGLIFLKYISDSFEEHRAKLVVTPNSVLLSKLNPHIPRIWLPDLHPMRRSVCSTEFIVACSKPGLSREYLFSLFTSSAFASVYGTPVTGTTGSHQRIRPESVLEMKVVIPPPALIQNFTTVAKPMFDRINRNTEQSRTLATLRDTLLPKLLSGELAWREHQQ